MLSEPRVRQQKGFWEREFLFEPGDGRFELFPDEAGLENGVLTVVLKHLGPTIIRVGAPRKAFQPRRVKLQGKTRALLGMPSEAGALPVLDLSTRPLSLEVRYQAGAV